MAKDQPDNLGGLSLKFLEDLKARFGEQSPQSRNVYETLGAFTRGELSKRDVHKTILDTLEGHDDLRQRLMDILLHPEARWTPGDFDLPIEQQMQPILEPTPQFLQPAHQPQMNLPSIPSKWYPLPQVGRTASSGVFSIYNGYYNGDSSPTLPVLAPFLLPDPSSHLWTDHNAQITYTTVDIDGPVPPPIRTAFRNPWEDPSYDDNWTNDGFDFPVDSTYIDERYQHDRLSALAYTNNVQLPMMHLQEAESEFRPISSEQEAPQILHNPQLTYDLLSPPTNHHLTQSVSEEQYPGDNHVPLTPVSVSPTCVQTAEEHTEENGEEIATDLNHSLGGPFIHALCGKGFATPSKVKKHHWGKKHNDFATTTGCWAKYKKPDVAWDDHPSCKDGRPTSETPKSVPSLSRQIRSKAAIPDSEAQPVLSTMQQNTILGFPTLDDLPHTVAEALSIGTATSHTPQGLDPDYHTHSVPSCSSFDSLLTAVNVVSQIDAPQPQSQTDSIALHLDAQVAATERHAQHPFYVPFKALTSSFDRRFVRPVVPTILDTTGPSMEVPLPHGMSTPYLEHGSDRHSSLRSSDVEEFHTSAACSRPLEPTGTRSSGPTRKRRKM